MSKLGNILLNPLSSYNDIRSGGHSIFYFDIERKLSYLIEFFILQFVQQFTQGFLPISFNNTWVSNAIRRQDEFQVSLRNDDDINIPFARTAQTERFPLTKFPKVWHNFPNENIKFQRNKLIFNEELKNHFLSQLKANYRCERLLCPHCHPPDRL